jgi:hypothetical protein
MVTFKTEGCGWDIGKGNAQIRKDFYASRRATALAACQDLPGAEVISWRDDAGTAHAVRVRADQRNFAPDL